MSFYWDSEGSPVGSILRGVYCPSLGGIITLPITSACMCVWAFVAVLIFWPLVFHVLYKPINMYWDYRIIPRDWQGSEELPCFFLLFLQILTTDPWGSEGLWGCLLGLFCFADPKLRPQAHPWLGQVRAASLCWGGAGNWLPGLSGYSVPLCWACPSPSAVATYLPSTLVFFHGLGWNWSIS